MTPIKPNQLKYGDINIGDVFSFERKMDETLVNEFAKLTGDYNPLHTDEKYAKGTEFSGRIVHGMLAGSLFSALVGMLCPGERALYLSQNVRFRNSLPLGALVVIEGKVISKFDAAKIIDLATVVRNKNGKIFVEGTAKVKVRE